MPNSPPAPLIAGLQRRLLALLVVVLLPVVAVFVWTALQGQKEQLAQAHGQLQASSRLAALGAERHVEGTRQLLNAVSSGPSVKGSGLQSLCVSFLSNIRSNYPYYTALGLFNADGMLECHSSAAVMNSSVSDRSYFKRVIESRVFVMGLYQIGRVTGQASLGFAMPVYDNDVKLKGVAYAGLELAQLGRALNNPLPAGIRVSITDRQGTVVAVDKSQAQTLIGGKLLDSGDEGILAQTMRRATDAVVEAKAADGSATLYSVSSVFDDAGPGLYVVASMPVSVAASPAWWTLVERLLSLLLMAALAIAAAVLVANRILVAPARGLLDKVNRLSEDSGVSVTQSGARRDAMGALSAAIDGLGQQLRQRDVQTNRQQTALRDVQSRLLAAQRIACIGNWELDLASGRLWWSDQTYVMLGYEPGAIEPSLESVADLVFAEDLPAYAAAYAGFFESREPLDFECRVQTHSGKIRWMRLLGEMRWDDAGHPLFGAGTVQDVTDRVTNERLLAAEARALLALSMDMPLKAVLEEVLMGLDSVLSGAMGSILLVSPDGKFLQPGAAPRLPEAFSAALNNLPIGPASGSCGTAAFRRAPVVVEDIETDPLCRGYQDLARAHGLRACWSTPVMNAAGVVLATFAIYYRQSRKPLPEELELAHRAASVIGIAIERERKNAALRASEARFRNSFLGASAGMAVTTLNGGFVEVNPAYCRMVGYSADELYGVTVAQVIQSARWPARQARMQALINGEVTSFVSEDPYQTRDGRTVWIRVSVSLLRDVHGSPEGFVSIAEDINTERETALALQRAQASLNMASRVGRLGGWWVDLDTQELAIHMSDVACEIYGIAPGTVLTKAQAAQPYPGDDHERILLLFDRCASRATPFDEELQFVNTQGELIWVRSIGEAVTSTDGTDDTDDGDGKVVRVQGAIQDISARKQAQLDLLKLNAELEARVTTRTEQLEAANKELEAFSYSVSHDLRAPLNTVNGFAQLLDKSNGANLTDKGKHHLSRIRAGALQMSALIEGLLSLAKLNRNALKLEAIDLSALTQRIEQDCRAHEPERQVKVQIQPDMQVHADATLLVVVMQNLFGNAWKYTARQAAPHIEVGASQAADGSAVYFVKDNGAGFDMAYADQLFGAFQRLHTASEFSGTGIGLANVKRVINRHGGRVWAEGVPNQGATFYFTLPGSPTPAPAPTQLG